MAPFSLTLEGYTPPKRVGSPWTKARIEEALTAAGPWTSILLVTLDPVDADPQNPVARSFEVNTATLQYGYYRVIFLDANDAESLPSDPRSSGPPASSLLVYATVDDLVTRYPELTSRPEEDLVRALVDAQADIDDYAGFIVPDDVTGLKFVLADQTSTVALGIRNATCAQARYRLYMGPVFFIEQVQYKQVDGDIGASRASRIGPEAKQYFPQGFRKLTGTFT